MSRSLVDTHTHTWQNWSCIQCRHQFPPTHTQLQKVREQGSENGIQWLRWHAKLHGLSAPLGLFGPRFFGHATPFFGRKWCTPIALDSHQPAAIGKQKAAGQKWNLGSWACQVEGCKSLVFWSPKKRYREIIWFFWSDAHPRHVVPPALPTPS